MKNILVNFHDYQVNHILKSLAMLLSLMTLALFIFKIILFKLFTKKLEIPYFSCKHWDFYVFPVWP